MRRRQPRRPAIPRLWMMTDERQGPRLWTALARLPRGAGVVFRHYRLPAAERRTLFVRVAGAARRRGLILLLAGENPGIGRIHYDGRHGARAGPGLRSASAHDAKELRAAERKGADLVFLSPVFPTSSHPETRGLGPLRFRLLARQTRLPAVALGGMNLRRAQRLRGSAYGWAAIDAWTENVEA